MCPNSPSTGGGHEWRLIASMGDHKSIVNGFLCVHCKDELTVMYRVGGTRD